MKEIIYEDCNNNIQFIKEMFLKIGLMVKEELMWNISNFDSVPVNSEDYSGVGRTVNDSRQRVYLFQQRILNEHTVIIGHKELLNLSEYVVPVCMLVLGYPAEDHFKRQKPERCKLEDIICVDHYHRKNEQELENMFEHKAGNKTLNEWATAFCNRKYNSDFSKEMTKSVQKYIDQFKSEAD